MLRVSDSLLLRRRDISSLMLSSESSPTNLRASMRASSSAIGCSNSRNFRSIATGATATLAPYRPPSRVTSWRDGCRLARARRARRSVSALARRPDAFASLCTKGAGRAVPSKLCNARAKRLPSLASSVEAFLARLRAGRSSSARNTASHPPLERGCRTRRVQQMLESAGLVECFVLSSAAPHASGPYTPRGPE